MNRFCLLLALILGFSACNKSETKTENQAVTETQNQSQPETGTPPIPEKENLSPDVITKLPETMEGCTGLFAYTKEALKKGEYVFAYKLNGAGILKIDGKSIELDLIEESEKGEGGSQQIYAKDQYKVILTTKKTKQTGDEVAEYEGTLEIYKDVSERKLNVIGEVGC